MEEEETHAQSYLQHQQTETGVCVVCGVCGGGMQVWV